MHGLVFKREVEGNDLAAISPAGGPVIAILLHCIL